MNFLSEHLATIQQGLRIAMHTADNHARTLTQCAESGGNAMISPDAARELARQHRANRDDFSRVLGMIDEYNTGSFE